MIKLTANLTFDNVDELKAFIELFKVTQHEKPLRKMSELDTVNIELTEETDAPAEVELWLEELVQDKEITSYEIKSMIHKEEEIDE